MYLAFLMGVVGNTIIARWFKDNPSAATMSGDKLPEVTHLAESIINAIKGPIQGNRGDNTEMYGDSLAVICAAVYKRCIEILESEVSLL